MSTNLRKTRDRGCKLREDRLSGQKEVQTTVQIRWSIIMNALAAGPRT